MQVMGLSMVLKLILKYTMLLKDTINVELYNVTFSFRSDSIFNIRVKMQPKFRKNTRNIKMRKQKRNNFLRNYTKQMILMTKIFFGKNMSSNQVSNGQ